MAAPNSRPTAHCGSPRTKAPTSSGSARSTPRPAGSPRSRPSRAGTSRASTFPTTAGSSPMSSTRRAVSRLKLLDAAHPPGPHRRRAPGRSGRRARRRALGRHRRHRSPRPGPPSDVYSVNPRTLAVTRWTESETGGLDPKANVEPELVETTQLRRREGLRLPLPPRSRPKFPGQRPLIVNIHGGPEGQSRPGFLGRNNYYLNELGVAIFYPNVRGSTGFGKRFVALDNGPDQRENSVKDHRRLPRPARQGPAGSIRPASRVTGGSYGGYMCYASAIRYGDRFKAANCIVAISNFVTFLENTQCYRRDLRRVEYGDERDPAQRAKLLAISPLTRVERAQDPADGHDRRQRSARARVRGRPDHPGGPRQWRHRLAPARPGRRPWLRQEGQPGLRLLDQPDVLAAQPARREAEAGASDECPLTLAGEGSAPLRASHSSMPR